MWAFAWLFVLEAVAITTANAVTIVIFTRTSRLHSKHYIMIISQAVADFFVGLVSVPIFTAWMSIHQSDTYSPLLKNALYIQESFFGGASLFGLAALAIERAHATYFPFRHSTLGKGPYIIGIVLMWAAPFILVLSNIVVEERVVQIILITAIGFILLIISSAYFLIVLKVRCTTSQAHDVNIQENKKLTVTLAIVTILSLVMWLPFQCLAAVYFKVSHFFLYSVKFLQYGNSLINCIIYAFRMHEIRREILRVFQCCRNRQISVIRLQLNNVSSSSFGRGRELYNNTSPHV